MTPYDAPLPPQYRALQLAARDDPHDRVVLADWYEEHGHRALAASTRQLHGLYRPDTTTMAEVMSSRPEVSRLWRDELPQRPHRTRKRVNKMTAAEAAQMPGWAEKWVAIGLSTERADRPRFEAAVAACYRYSGLANPRAIIWAPCPIVVTYAGSIATAVLRRLGESGTGAVGNINSSVQRSVYSSIHGSLDDSVSSAVNNSVADPVCVGVAKHLGDNVHGHINASINDNVAYTLDDCVAGSVRAGVRDGVNINQRAGASVDDSLFVNVHASVCSSETNLQNDIMHSVADSVRAAVPRSADMAGQLNVYGESNYLDQWSFYNGGQFWVGWYWWGPASTSFALDVLRLDIGHAQELKARAYAAALSSACWWWPHRDFVIVSERPTLIAKHPNGKLRDARWEWTDAAGKRCAWSVKP